MDDGFTDLRRRGLLLDILAEMSSVERQLVAQTQKPWAFVPDDLVERWDTIFLDGYGLTEIGFSSEALVVLLDFDAQLGKVVGELLPTEDNKADYIRNDEMWSIVRDLADRALTLLAQLAKPKEPGFSLN